MYERFNCGVGFVVAVDPGFYEEAMKILKAHKPMNLNAEITPKERDVAEIKIVDRNFEPGAYLIF